MLIFGLILLIGSQMGFNNNRTDKMEALGKLSNVKEAQYQVIANYESGKAMLQIFKPGILHFTLERGDEARKSFAVVESPGKLPDRVMDVTREKIVVNFPDGSIRYSPESMSLSFHSKDGADLLDLDSIEFSDTGMTAKFDFHGARNFYGLGEKTLPYNRYGSRWTMWNSDFPAYGVKFDPLYESVPFLLKADSSGAYGLFFDNTSKSNFDVGATLPDNLIYSARAGALELYIITGKNAADVVKKLADLTGKMHMPPIWSLGYQQSRWSYYPESEVLDLARGFRKNKIPCDVIYLDIDYMDGYRCFTWSPKNFPTPVSMLDTLHDKGFKVVTIIDPGIKEDKGYGVYDSGVKKDVFVKMPNGKYFVGRVWPGDCVFPDFFNKKTRQWWGEQYKSLLRFGVDGFWNDMNEPSVFNTPNKTFPLDAVHVLDDGTAMHYEVHNAYGMQMARATREGLEKLEPDKRPFVLTRANYAGGQRYAAMWTGDNFASFAHLKLALAMYLNIGVSGQPFVGSDVGGFVGNPSAELFTRWLELGTFTPFFRTHSVKDSKPREPWAFGPEFTAINRRIIDRRYKMMPEVYTAFRNAHESGLPIVRPLYLDFPEDTEAYKISNEFLFGSKLLVAPVLDSGVVKRGVYLPPGNWASIYDGLEIPQGWHEVVAPLGETPVFVKEGTILFTQSLIQSTSEQADTLFLRVYGRESAAGDAYFDDGHSLAYRDGDFLSLGATFKSDGTAGKFEFSASGGYTPGYKELAVQLAVTGSNSFTSAIAVTRDGQRVIGVISHPRQGLMQATFPFNLSITTIHLK